MAQLLQNFPEITKAVCKRTFDVNIQQEGTGYTCMHVILEQLHIELARMSPSAETIEDLLFFADILVQQGADLTRCNTDGLTPNAMITQISHGKCKIFSDFYRDMCQIHTPRHAFYRHFMSANEGLIQKEDFLEACSALGGAKFHDNYGYTLLDYLLLAKHVKVPLDVLKGLLICFIHDNEDFSLLHPDHLGFTALSRLLSINQTCIADEDLMTLLEEMRGMSSGDVAKARLHLDKGAALVMPTFTDSHAMLSQFKGNAPVILANFREQCQRTIKAKRTEGLSPASKAVYDLAVCFEQFVRQNPHVRCCVDNHNLVYDHSKRRYKPTSTYNCDDLVLDVYDKLLASFESEAATPQKPLDFHFRVCDGRLGSPGYGKFLIESGKISLQQSKVDEFSFYDRSHELPVDHTHYRILALLETFQMHYQRYLEASKSLELTKQIKLLCI